ncbi:hypothetical protein COLO4_07442 [Corchorus olitorius]|uniref:Uncharacterized protein n=1 Tax=Corchorus olitorius TaxID=93759 RepID=A0A1R3KJQ6_9ROSI|nr:hypothetical protein COLO4_07442 [Corchorus olitorius]
MNTASHHHRSFEHPPLKLKIPIFPPLDGLNPTLVSISPANPSSTEAMPCLVSTISELEIRSSTLHGFKVPTGPMEFKPVL